MIEFGWTILGTSAVYHVIHFGAIFGVPALFFVVLWLRERNREPLDDQTMSPEERQRRLASMYAAFGTIPPQSARQGAQRAGGLRPVRALPRPGRRSAARGRPFVLAALSAGAGIVHAGVTTEHFREYWLFGVFFIAAASLQVAWAGLLFWDPSRWVLALAAIGNASVVALWAITRTAGLPFGPEAGNPEAVGARDVAATACEIVLAVWCVLLLRKGGEEGMAARLARSRALGVLVFAASAISLAFRPS